MAEPPRNAGFLAIDLDGAHPDLPKVRWMFRGMRLFGVPAAEGLAQQIETVRRWADALGVEPWEDGGVLGFGVDVEGVWVIVWTGLGEFDQS